MLEFIKMFGLGVFYTLISPLILVFFILCIFYALINYFVCEAINLSGFFLGKRFVAETKLQKDMEKSKKKKVIEKVEEEESSKTLEDGDINE